MRHPGSKSIGAYYQIKKDKADKKAMADLKKEAELTPAQDPVEVEQAMIDTTSPEE